MITETAPFTDFPSILNRLKNRKKGASRLHRQYNEEK